MIHSFDQCSPKSFETFEKTGSCLINTDLQDIAKHLKVPYTTREDLKKHVKTKNCDNEKSPDACLLNSISDKKLCRKIKSKFRTPRPETWYLPGKERTWLTNRDIDHVMQQYASKRFVFMGAMPVDFATVLSNGACVEKGMCNFKPKFKTRSFGFVFNLDVHTGSGTHWTALFGSADHKDIKYGIFFFCSYGQPPPIQVKMLMDVLVKYLEEKHPESRRKISKGYNKKRYQHKNTECGIFSCAFLIRCLENKKESYQEALSTIGNDDTISLLRNVMFRFKS